MDAIARVTQIQIRAVTKPAHKARRDFAVFLSREKSLTQLSGGERC